MEQNPAIALVLALGIIIAASRIGGGLARLLNQPRVLGELIAGVLLGPTFLDLLHLPLFHGVELDTTIKELAELGVILLMFIIGFEVNLKELMTVRGVATFAGVLGVALPVGLTLALMRPFGFGWQESFFAGVTLAATSVSISAQVLFELGHLRTKEGSALLATALIDDVLAIVLVSLAVAVVGSDGGSNNGFDPMQLGAIVLRMALYIGGAFVVAWFGLPRLMNRLDRLPSVQQSYGLPAIALIAIFLFAWSAEELGGVATITGSFLAGLGLGQSRERVQHQIEQSINGIAYAFLVPVFFIDVGLETDLSAFPLETLPFALLLLLVAIVSKVVGCGFGGLMGGFTMRESLRLGVCMVSRGEVGLIIASLGVSIGVFQPDQPLFASVFLVILLTTLITPILVRWVFAQKPDPNASSEATPA